MGQFEKWLSSSKVTRRVLLFLLILIVGWLDLCTGYEYSFSIFYLLPVFIVAWFDNKGFVILTILFSGATRFYTDVNSDHIYVNALAPYWNAFVRIIFFSIFAFLVFKIRRNLAAMTMMAMQDSLTSLNNTRAFNLEYQLIRQKKSNDDHKKAIAIIDLDCFKNVNDTYGHSQGDVVLVEFSKILKETSRKTDIVARLGGDEFVVILKNTDMSSIQNYEERLRSEFNKSQLKQKFGVNFSMGVGIFNDLPDNLDDATHLVDQLMYQSKQAGKSQTTMNVF